LRSPAEPRRSGVDDDDDDDTDDDDDDHPAPSGSNAKELRPQAQHAPE